MFANDFLNLRLGHVGHNGLAYGRAVDRVSPSYARCHAHRAGRLDLIEVNHLEIVEDAEVDGLAGLQHKPFQKGPRTFTEIELGDGSRAQLKQLQAQAITSID